MDTAPEERNEDFRLDRTQFSVGRVTDPDDALEYWLSRQSKNGCGRSNSSEGRSMAIPTLARDFKEFLKSLNSSCVEYLPK
jgi:hypothetical protein